MIISASENGEPVRVSIVIATYNRAESLRRTLSALAQQTYPNNSYMVVVADDGSSDNTREVCENSWPFRLQYLPQVHAGGTNAKNAGALASQGDLLVFLDDDITVVPQFIRCLVKVHLKGAHSIVVGELYPVVADKHPPERISYQVGQAELNDSSVDIPFADCLGGFFSVRRSDYFSLGMLQDPAPGFWPNWEDVDLAYRAYQQGFQFRKSLGAVGYHWDHVLSDLKTRYRRWERAGQSAARLFHKHPDLPPYLPMFHDKLPIAWRQDSAGLITRKLARYIASSRPVLWSMEQVARTMEWLSPSSKLLPPLYRWIIGGYTYRGFRQGLEQYGPLESQPG
jgi:glycosyltransferase involved in cell wall biosynthesis